MRRALATVSIVLALAACVPPPKPGSEAPPTAVLPSGFPESVYRQAAARGEAVFRVDPERSALIVYVYRGGRLARLGHDHVISSRDLRGHVWLAEDSSQSRADLYLPVAGMTIDDAELRAEAGFDTQPSEKDIEGTRTNMLGKVLDPAAYPYVRLRAGIAMGEPPRVLLDIDLTWQGVTRRITVPTDLTIEGDTLRASGEFEVWQSAFGIEPFSVLGGALRVQDRLDIRFELNAARWSPQ